MANPKPIRIEYQSKRNVTGKTDVKAQIYVNGVAKATGTNAVTLTEVDSTNSPGLYELNLTTSILAGYGIAAGAENTVSGYINSASASAAAPFRIQISYYTSDEVITALGTPAGASVSADIASIYSRLGAPSAASVSADIAAINAQNVSALSQLTALTNAAQSGTGIAMALPGFLTGTSANTYVIPFTITNNDGVLVNASGGVTIGLKNQAGTDRGSYLSGSSGSPATVAATNNGTGQYSVTMVVPASAPEEELIFSASYTVNSVAVVKYYISQLELDFQTSGYALQTTSTAIQTTVNTINSAVANATYGLSALQQLLVNGTYGLSSLQSLLANSTYGLSALQTILANGTYGLSALANILNNGTYGLSALQAQNVATQGTGFTAGTDDLRSISQYVRANIFSGGRAV